MLAKELYSLISVILDSPGFKKLLFAKIILIFSLKK
jgi:hypothetical protein